MKTKQYTFFVILLFISLGINAQRYFDAKVVGGNLLVGKRELGINGFYEKLFGYNKNSIFIDATISYQNEKLKTQTYKANILDTDLGISYRRYFEHGMDKLPYIGIGAFCGYDTFINKNKLPKSVIYKREFGFNYGVFLDLGFEYMFENFGLNITFRPKYDAKNQNLNSSFLIGFKYYLN